MSRSAAQEREERAILQEAAEIEAKRRLEAAAIQAAALKVDKEDTQARECNYGLAESRNNPSLCSSTGVLQKPAFPGLHGRRKYTKNTAAEILDALPGGQRMQKLFEAALSELGVPILTAATRASCSAWIQLHVELVELLGLKGEELLAQKGPVKLFPPEEKAVEKTPKEIKPEKTVEPKREQPIDITTSLLGGRQRRDIKRKTPSRYDDMAMTPSRPESKRTRK